MVCRFFILSGQSTYPTHGQQKVIPGEVQLWKMADWSFFANPEMCEVGKGGNVLFIDLTGSP